MEASLRTIDKMVADLQSLLPMKPEYQQKLDKKIRLEFNYNSNHIEGNTLTYGETELLLIFDKTTGNHELREYEEMKSHDVAFEKIKEWAGDKDRALTEADIKELHRMLLVRPFWKEAITPDGQPTRRLIEVGAYKKYPNSVQLQNGEIFHYASPEETPMQMGELIDWYRSEEYKIHPVTLAAMLHYKFVRIHPFDDGNGRISRFLMNYVLLRNSLPPVVIKSADKKNYMFALNQADAGDFKAFVSYIGEQVIWSLEIYTKAATGETLEEADDIDKEVEIFKKSIAKSKERREVRSSKNIKAVIEHSIVRLFARYIVKMQHFDSLFHKAENRIVYSTTYTGSYDVKQRRGGFMLSTEQFPTSLKNFLNTQSEIMMSEIVTFGLEYSLKGYKTAYPFDITAILDVVFEEYTYSITRKGDFLPNDHYIEKNYEDPLREEDIVYSINDIAKETLSYLKDRGQ